MKIVKKLLCALTIVIMGIAMFGREEQVSAANSSNWKQLYKEFLIENQDKIYNCECGYINNDDIPELIYNLREDCPSGWFAPTAPVYIATVSKNGKLISFSALPERTYGQLNFYEKSGVATCGDMQQGYIWGKVYQFDQNWNSKVIKSFSSYDEESDFYIDGKAYNKSSYKSEQEKIFSNYENKYGEEKSLPEKNLVDYYIYLFTDPSEIEVAKPKVTLKTVNSGTGVKITIGNTKGAERYYIHMISCQNENSAYLPYNGEFNRMIAYVDKFNSKKYTYTIDALPKGKYTFTVVAYSKYISVYDEYGEYMCEDCNTAVTKKSIKVKAAAKKTVTEKKYDFSSVKVGDIIKYGRYEQDGNMTDGQEDIEWIVLEKKKGKMLVLSKYVLDCLPYDNSSHKDTWETCSLRKWLNKKFYKNAFTEKERSKICKVTLKNPDNPDYGRDGGNNTKDRVFLLSTDDINNTDYGFAASYRVEDSKRKCTPTYYAELMGVETYDWILRSGYDDRVTYVSGYGWVALDGVYIDGSFLGYEFDDSVPGYADRPGIRPAMYISIK